MTDDRQDSAVPEHINPYQAPAYHADEAYEVGDAAPVADAPGYAFWITAAASTGLAVAAIAVVGALALPLPLALMGATVRATVIFAHPRRGSQQRLSAILLLFTSTLVMLALMFCCAIAFATVCTAGALAGAALTVPAASTWMPMWTFISGVLALGAFTFMFIRSTKWGA